jgi:hypothetical protein
MHQFLKNEMSAGMGRQMGSLQKQPKVFQVAMKVASHHDLRRYLQGNEVALPPGSILKGLDGLANGSKKAGGIRHGKRKIGSGRSSTGRCRW